MKSIRTALISSWLSLSPVGVVIAQVPNEFDFDRASLPFTTIPPNGSPHTITGLVTYTNQNLQLNAPLTVRSGAELRLNRSILKVFGTIVMEEGSRVTVTDSSLFLPCLYSRQFELINEGGVLHTERAVLGSTHVGTSLSQTFLMLHRGTWLARQTVAQALITLIGDGRQGWLGNPLHKGGAVFADGLYEGQLADAIHAGGMGDVTLANGTMNVGFYFDAAGSPQPSTAVLDLDSRSRLNIVYGDPSVHSGVTAPVALNPRRLELRNHRSASWQLFASNASATGPLQTILLRNAEDIICNFRGTNLVGAPVLSGPWATYYTDLPGLPSTLRPGHHALPPGCSVRLGNVAFQSGPGPNDWNRISTWGLYTNGTGTNLALNGPTALSELWMRDGQLTIAGTGSFDMGLACQTVNLYGTANLNITNTALGQFGPGSSAVGFIGANENSVCTINGSRVAPMRLHTSGSGSITGQNLYYGQSPVIDSSGGGVVNIIQAMPGQDSDRQNLDFESSLAGSLPSFWSGQSVTGSQVAIQAPGSLGTRSYQLSAQAANGFLRKQLALPTDTFVTMLGWTRVVQAPTGGAPLWLQTVNGASVTNGAIGLTPNLWKLVHVPTLTVANGTLPTVTRFLAGGLPATVQLDDFRVHIGSWWDNDNLGNLDFERGYLFQGQAPSFRTEPDAWRGASVSCAADVTNVRPGAAPGSRSVALTLQGQFGGLSKDLTFLRAGDILDVAGWVRGVTPTGPASAEVIIGNGPTFYVVGLGNNQHSGNISFNGAWHQFQMTYVVPPNPSFTRMNLGLSGAVGAQGWFDDITVTIR